MGMCLAFKRIILLMCVVCLTAQLPIVGTQAGETDKQKGLLVFYRFKIAAGTFAIFNLFYEKGLDDFELQGAAAILKRSNPVSGEPSRAGARSQSNRSLPHRPGTGGEPWRKERTACIC